jgi:hypothetical protein
VEAIRKVAIKDFQEALHHFGYRVHVPAFVGVDVFF